jgi:PAS domain S-box-containing protein
LKLGGQRLEAMDILGCKNSALTLFGVWLVLSIMENFEMKKSKKPESTKVKPLTEGINLELLPNLMHNLQGMAYRCKNDSQWTMLFVSEGCISLTGYTANELVNNALLGYDALILEADRDLVRNTINEAVKLHQQFQLEYRIITKSGELKWVWEKGNAVYDQHHNPTYLDGFITDVSARRNAEEDLKKAAANLAELNATKDRFFSLIAHDLQNPVYAIISLSEFAAENLQSFGPQEIENALFQVNSAARGIFTLLENLLDWAKLQTMQVQLHQEVISLRKTIRYAMEHYRKAAEQKGIKIEFESKEDLMVESDLKLISSILRNLISNALKYSYPKSTVQILLSLEQDKPQITVKDHGIGIARRYLANIFRIDSELRQYGTANESGSGLGLILVNEFSKLLGAEVAVESKLNRGTQFTLKLPGRI